MQPVARPTIFTVAAHWDAEAGVWSGSCDAVPVAAEAETLDGLLAAIETMTADVLPDNHPDVDPAAVYFQLSALREMESRPAAA
ncbi:DUF1902 domain-containing protein [Aureimonas leprariae]|uniref:DUF1902 domain-containing protein n=1 Tax=Plantimonas leprariae TaxID=2615207 RepID=A0A7V7PNP6_9HYPH|nr:DUF1902 domain-containing protein [Aureimonas leprariae]KAB0679397.1 DUF1902 domain-containing protein [Aureimonas leprariae]